MGDKLSENTLARKLGISRTPVREALQILKAEGLVEARPQRGTFVFTVTAQEINHICELRAIFEIGAIRIAIEQHRDRLVEALHRNVQHAQRALRDEDLLQCHMLDTQFHAALIAACENPYLIESYKIIKDHVEALRYRLPLTYDRMANAISHHQQIAACAKAAQIAQAESLLMDHIERVRRLLHQQPEPTTRSVNV